ncbi:PH domain-containing protein [Cytobacillus praedii]|uniref:PH domain-containing protein n=1 Tax=Cytobacillus praedii TaxID=1742358 RepID=UPI00070D433C|nr:PH domain-containing protein [Cytobacillus praedii]MED3551847.1 PH domain-containing protein [Cytobacillus praedii]
MMTVQIEVGDTALIVNISGGTMFTTLRKRIEIPYNFIEEVQVGNFKFPLTAIKRTGITTMGYKAGIFIIDKKKYFLSYHDANKVAILGLKEFEFDRIVIENEDSEQLVKNILMRCSHIK